MKKFSIVIPAYNSAQYIEKCIMSIIKQNYNCDDFEIVIVNDNSLDSTGFKISQIKQKYPNITIKSFYNEKNIGASASRNIGIGHAQGEYLLFFDSDDYLVHKNVLSGIDEKLKEEGQPDVLIFGCVMNYKKSDGSSIYKAPLIPKKREESKKFQLTKKIIRFVWPMCVKRDLIEKNGIRFQEDIDMYEDTIFRSQTMAYAKRIKTYSKVCYNYNRILSQKSMSSNTNIGMSERLQKLIKATKRIDELAKKGEVPAEQVDDFRKTMLLFFPGVIVFTGNHILSMIATKAKNNKKKRQLEMEK